VIDDDDYDKDDDDDNNYNNKYTSEIWFLTLREDQRLRMF